MKTLLIVLLALGSLSAFAGKFDNMKVEEIYWDGYVLKATVLQKLGAVIKAGRDKVALNTTCDVHMKKTSAKRRILRTGRKIITSSQSSTSWLYLYSSSDRSVSKIGLWSYSSSSTLSQINKACNGKIIFTVILDRTLEEAQMPREMPVSV